MIPKIFFLQRDAFLLLDSIQDSDTQAPNLINRHLEVLPKAAETFITTSIPISEPDSLKTAPSTGFPISFPVPGYLRSRIKKGFHRTSIILLFLADLRTLGGLLLIFFPRRGLVFIAGREKYQKFHPVPVRGGINSKGTYFKLDLVQVERLASLATSFPFINSVRLVPFYWSSLVVNLLWPSLLGQVILDPSRKFIENYVWCDCVKLGKDVHCFHCFMVSRSYLSIL